MALAVMSSTWPLLASTRIPPHSSLKIPKINLAAQTPATPFTQLTCLSKKDRNLICLVANGKRNLQKEVKREWKNRRKSGAGGDGTVILSEGRDVDESNGLVCPGCGDPNLPGFYKKRERVVVSGFEESDDDDEEDFEIDDYDGDVGFEDFDDGDDVDEEEDVGFEDLDDGDDDMEVADRGDKGSVSNDDNDDDGIDWEGEEFEEDSDDDLSSELLGFEPAGVGYGNVTEETVKELKKKEKKKMSKSERKRLARMAEKDNEEQVLVCARCHSLRNYGQVKNEMAENLIPDFDFDRLITMRLMKPSGKSDATVVVMVVDCSDFDGSFPKCAAKSLFKVLDGSRISVFSSRNLPKLVLVATKVDLLPSQISPTRLDTWVRQRARALGAPKMNAVFLVSARKDLGVRNLLAAIKDLAGPRGNVWIIGAQNAGKSTLINTFAKKGGAKITRLTEAAVPGTTLGILRVGGILPGKAKMYDTPGLLHPYLMSMRLKREEQKMIEIRKELQPRTYRIKAGQTVFVGGLMRLDLCQASVQTIYLTIWASPNVSLHLGKTENAEETFSKHVALRLQPPVSTDRVSELGEWQERQFKVTGTSWDLNSSDIVVAGFGWCSLGLKGEATLKLWTYQGIEVLLREPLVLDRAPFIERPGFWLPKAISDAIGNQSRIEAQQKKQLQERDETSLLDVVARIAEVHEVAKRQTRFSTHKFLVIKSLDSSPKDLRKQNQCDS
ncbi:GTP-binding protein BRASSINAZOLE INSENSITIVE PALE GREEN 2, chloroplastic-like protein [Drosera capensis]